MLLALTLSIPPYLLCYLGLAEVAVQQHLESQTFLFLAVQLQKPLPQQDQPGLRISFIGWYTVERFCAWSCNCESFHSSLMRQCVIRHTTRLLWIVAAAASTVGLSVCANTGKETKVTTLYKIIIKHFMSSIILKVCLSVYPSSP